MSFCENCGNKVSDTSKFCVQCGYQLRSTEITAVINPDSPYLSVKEESIQPIVSTDHISDNTINNMEINNGSNIVGKNRKPFYKSTWFWLLLLVSYYMIDTGNTTLLIPVIIIAVVYLIYHGLIKKGSWWGK